VVPQELIAERITEQDNALGRFATWIATIQLALQAPIFGVGLHNLGGLLNSQVFSVGGFWNYSTPHNSLLSMFAELGVVGLVVYLAAITTIIKMGVRLYRTGAQPQDRWRGLALVAIMVAYLMPALFANTLYTPDLIHIYVYVFAGSIAGIYGSRRRRS